MNLDDDSRRFRIVFCMLAALAVSPFWVGEYMPLSDLPQHAAQLSIGQHWNDPAYHYKDYFEVNWYTQQLFAYNCVRLFALVFPLIVSIKLVLSLAVVGLGLSVLAMVRAVRGDPWTALVAFPIGFSFSMYWGFFNFVTALPLGFGLIALSASYAVTPTRRRAVAMLVLANVLFFAHVLILAYVGLVSAVLIALRGKSWRVRIEGSLALASVLPTTYLWWTTIQSQVPSTTATPVRLELGWHRVRDYLAMQVTAESEDKAAIWIGAGLLLLPFLLGSRFTRERWRYAPIVINVLAFAFVPSSAIEVDLIYGRLAVFALPSLLFALDPAPAAFRSRMAVCGLVAAELISVAVVFALFGREASGLDVVMEHAEPHKRVLYLPTDSTSAYVTGAQPYYHFGEWYQVKKGGLVDFSFAEFFPMWYRYRPELVPHLMTEFDSHCDNYSWLEHDGELYDYMLVRGPLLLRWFDGAQVDVRVIARADDWTLLSARPRQSLASRGSL